MQAQPGEKLTHGDVLEVVRDTVSDHPVTRADAAAIRSVESKAIGGPTPSGGLGAHAQSATAQNARKGPKEEQVTLGEVLQGAKENLASDKVVEPSEANRVARVERRVDPNSQSGIGATEQAAAKLNQPGHQDIIGTTTSASAGTTVPAAPTDLGGGGTTIGDVLENVARDKANAVITPSDAAAIQAAEAQALGPIGQRAQAAAVANLRSGAVRETPSGYRTIVTEGAVKIGDVLQDAKSGMVADAVMTVDAAKAIQSAESSADPAGHAKRGGVAAHAQSAAINNRQGAPAV